MKRFTVTFLPANQSVVVPAGDTLLHAQILAELHPDAPCGGKGTCGKCRVTLEGQEILSCQTVVDRDMTVYTKGGRAVQILTGGLTADTQPDGAGYAMAFDIGTTTLVCCLSDGMTGKLLSRSSAMNPQAQFGADVISRIQYVLEQNGGIEMRCCIHNALEALARDAAAQAELDLSCITSVAVAGNTAMHHLLLGIDPRPLVTPPYMPAVSQSQEIGIARILPNIAGFVGGDTVGCMVATRFDTLEELTLMIDIGTNGEMVLGNRHRRVACSTAAGPAFEGARISCGMRGATGAVDHVWLEDGKIRYHVIGGGQAVGLCGSGLLDLIATLLDAEIMDESGCLENGSFSLCEAVTLTQKDVREVQLAKAAIRAGIELLSRHLGVSTADIQSVYLAGAFGNFLDPASACRIGMIPPALLDRIHPIGNAAGEGTRLCALSRKEFEYSKDLAAHTEFLELASLPEFQDCYVDALEFSEDEP